MLITNMADNKIHVISGEISPISGYFVYDGSPRAGEIPCLVSEKEEAIVLNKGDTAPYITSCNNHAAKWKLVVEKKSTPLLHNL